MGALTVLGRSCCCMAAEVGVPPRSISIIIADGEGSLVVVSCDRNAAVGNLIDGTALAASPLWAAECVGERAGDCAVDDFRLLSPFATFSAGASASIRACSGAFASVLWLAVSMIQV